MPDRARPSASYRHVFWDMGGTIVNTYPQLDAALAGVVRRHGAMVSEYQVALLTRRSTGQAITALATRFGIAREEFREAEAALKSRWRTSPPPAMSGVQAVMGAVSGLNLVVTHRDRTSAQSLLQSLSIAVDDLVCAPDGYPRKPDPAMHLALVERHGLDVADCLAIGDRHIDSAAARAAGMASAMLRTPRIPLDNDAEFQIESLAELAELLA